MWLQGVGRSLLVSIVAGMVVAGCHTSDRRAAIGFAFTYHVQAAISVASEEIALHRQGRGPSVAIVYDSAVAGDPADVEVRRAEQLAAVPGIVAVVGHSGSRASLAAAPVYNEAGIVQVTPNSTSRLLDSAGAWTFNLAPDDSVEGAFIAAFVAEGLRASRVTIFYENDEYGTGLRDGAVAALAQHGVAVLDRVPVDQTSDFRTLVAASLTRGVPDVVVVAGRQLEAGSIARAMRERGVPRAVVAGDGALVLPLLTRAAGPAADSLYAVAFWMPDAPDSLSRAFVERYRRVAGEPPQSVDAMTHDALMLIADAVRVVGPSRAAIRRYLRELGASRPPYLGVTGPISFGPAAHPRLVMAHVVGGQPHRVVGP
jgi:branched-chain amino acid transport system substrate-binding protein